MSVSPAIRVATVAKLLCIDALAHVIETSCCGTHINSGLINLLTLQGLGLGVRVRVEIQGRVCRPSYLLDHKFNRSHILGMCFCWHSFEESKTSNQKTQKFMNELIFAFRVIQGIARANSNFQEFCVSHYLLRI